jgi:murein DD-endopeptidase MepM/ murein hydrolase activator NlpD
LLLRRRLLTGATLALVLIAIALPGARPALAASRSTDASAAKRGTAALPLVSYRLPFAAGETYEIGQGWNTRFSHRGRSAFAYDFMMPAGTPVLASAAGLVAFVDTGERACGGVGLLDHANYVTIYHADGTATQYGHLGRVDVAVGDVVGAGQPIGLSGATGYTGCAAHLHFARQAQGGPVTQSQPIYFEEYPGVEFQYGLFVTANPGCAGPETATETATKTATEPTTSAATTPFAATPTPPLAATNTFCGTYFYGTSSRMASMVHADPAIDFNWRSGRPNALEMDTRRTGVPELVARWDGTFAFPTSGPYDFDITTTDGVRLIIDGETVLDSWLSPPSMPDSFVSRVLTAGVHHIVLELHHQGVNAAIQLAWWNSNRAPE